jgi:hypothetical protein
MKTALIMGAFSLLVGFASPATSQTAVAHSVPAGARMPDFIGQIVGHNGKDPLVPLEERVPGHLTRALLLGYAGGEGRIIFQGAKSPVRFTDPRPGFYIRVASQALGLSGRIQLVALEPKDSTRELVSEKASPLGLSVHGAVKTIAIGFSKIGTDFFFLKPAVDLPPGEYAWLSAERTSDSMFGIDQPSFAGQPSEP